MARRSLLSIAVAALFLVSAACRDEKAPAAVAESDFLRFRPIGEEGGVLEAAVVSYRNRDGVRVDLIAAVHFADPEFYDTLELLFSGYEALLYELVAPEGMIPDRSKQSDDLMTRLKMRICRTFDMEYQLDAIDYDRPNFVHADLSLSELIRICHERGETPWTILVGIMNAQLRAMKAGMGQHLTSANLFDAIRSPDYVARLKLLMAREFENMEAMFAGMEDDEKGKKTKGGNNGSLLVGERNRAAIKVLKRELAAGRRKLGLFYGAAHMRDFEARLQKELGFEKEKQSWLTAWDIEPRAAPQRR